MMGLTMPLQSGERPRRLVPSASVPTFVDLFSGAGGLTQGLVDAGWRPLLAVDHWADAIRSYRQRFHDHPAVDSDIADLDKRRLVRLLDDRPEWVVGGPPCQGFSTVGKRLRTDPRNRLVEQFRRVVRDLEPEGIIVENVLGLKDMGAHGGITELFEELGYATTFQIVRAADFGIPQLRRRAVFVGHRSRGWMVPLKPLVDPTRYVTVWDAIGDLPVVGPGETQTLYEREPFTDYQRKLRGSSQTIQGHTVSAHPRHLVEAISYIPDGGNRFDIPDRLQPESGFHNSYSRLASDKPAVAVTGNMGKPSATRCIHPKQHRGLTAREGARLQSFPDDFHFAAGVTSQRLQIANAVPPILARSIGAACDSAMSWTSQHEPAQLLLALA